MKTGEQHINDTPTPDVEVVRGMSASSSRHGESARGSAMRGSGNGASPVRQCVGCRGKAPQTELLRIAVRDGAPMPDPGRRLSGRGAYVHHRRECLDRATRRGNLARALKTSVPASAVATLQRAVEGLLSSAAQMPELGIESGAAGRGSPANLEKPPIHGLTQPGPRFVVGTLHSKDQ